MNGFRIAISTRDWFIHQNIASLRCAGYIVPAASVPGVTPGLSDNNVGGNNPTPVVPPSGGVRPDSADSIVYLDSIQFTDVTIGQVEYDVQMGQHNLSGTAIEAAYIPVEVFCTGPVHWVIQNFAAQACVVNFTFLSVPRAAYDAYLSMMGELEPMGRFGALRVG